MHRTYFTKGFPPNKLISGILDIGEKNGNIKKGRVRQMAQEVKAPLTN